MNQSIKKNKIFKGKMGDPFKQLVIIIKKKHYILKLIHQVDYKIHACKHEKY